MLRKFFVGILFTAILITVGLTGVAGTATIGNTSSATELKVTNVFYQTDIREALQDIAAQVGINIVVDDSVEGVVSLTLKDVPLDKALEMICAAGGLDYVQQPGYIVVLRPSPDNPVFLTNSVQAWVKLNYLSPKEALSLLTSYEPYLRADENSGRLVITALPGLMMARIKQAIKTIDVPVLKKVEIRLVSLEYSRTQKSSIDLTSLGISLGKALADKSYAIQFGNQLFGASSKDELKTLLELQVLDGLGGLQITGDQKTMVLEGQTAQIFRSKEGSLFISVPGENTDPVQKEIVQASQGVMVKVIRVTSDDQILLQVNGKLEDIVSPQGLVSNGQNAVWVNRRSVQTVVPIKNYETIPIGTLIRKIKDNSKGVASRYSRNEEMETLFLLTAHVVGTKKPAKLAIDVDKKVKDFLEKSKKKTDIAQPTTFGVLVGGWFQSTDIAHAPFIIEGQLKLVENLRLFVGGGQQGSTDYLFYGGLRLGDLINVSVGGLNNSTNASQFNPFIGAGLSLGTDKLRLNVNYFYCLNAIENNGLRAGLEIRF